MLGTLPGTGPTSDASEQTLVGVCRDALAGLESPPAPDLPGAIEPVY